MRIIFKRFAVLLFIIPALFLGGCNMSQNEGFGTLMGAIAGATIGGDNKLAGAAIGALLGGYVGRSLDKESQHAMRGSFHSAMNTPYRHNHYYRWNSERSHGFFQTTRSFHRRMYSQYHHGYIFVSCRNFVRHITAYGHDHHSSGVACRDPYGRWRIVH